MQPISINYRAVPRKHRHEQQRFRLECVFQVGFCSIAESFKTAGRIYSSGSAQINVGNLFAGVILHHNLRRTAELQMSQRQCLALELTKHLMQQRWPYQCLALATHQAPHAAALAIPMPGSGNSPSTSCSSAGHTSSWCITKLCEAYLIRLPKSFGFAY